MKRFNEPMPRERADDVRRCAALRRGTVHVYFADIRMGIINGDNGGRYTFHATDLIAENVDPEDGMRVTFEPDAERAFRVRADDTC